MNQTAKYEIKVSESQTYEKDKKFFQLLMAIINILRINMRAYFANSGPVVPEDKRPLIIGGYALQLIPGRNIWSQASSQGTERRHFLCPSDYIP